MNIFFVIVFLNNEDIFLDSQTKQQIYATVAGATGYVKGRDQIVLSRADFSLLTLEDKAQLKKFMKTESRKQLLQKVVTIGGPIVFLLLSVLGLVSYIKKRRRDVLNRPKVEPEDDDAFVKNDDIDVDQYIEQVQSIADAEPGLVAKLMEDWLGPELPQQGTGNPAALVPPAALGPAAVNIPAGEAVVNDTFDDDFGDDDFDDLNFDDDFVDDLAEDVTS